MTGLQLQAQAELKAYNTLSLPAKAAWLATLTHVSQVEMLLAEAAYQSLRGLPRFILGAGSNLVLAKDFDGLVIRLTATGCTLSHEDDEAWYITAQAGESWHRLVQWSLAQGFPGLENLALIPGTVGAAPVQNIGAYGLELAERFHQLCAIDLNDGSRHVFDKSACCFAYRDSLFKQACWHQEGRFLITEVSLRLPKLWVPVLHYQELAACLAQQKQKLTPQAIADAVVALRQHKLPDPAQLPNVGSFFKNPVVSNDQLAALQARYPALPCYPQSEGYSKIAAAWLIEQTGWKGRNLGPVGMYQQQALVMVNHGAARGSDVHALTQQVQRDVYRSFGICLEPEPIWLG